VNHKKDSLHQLLPKPNVKADTLSSAKTPKEKIVVIPAKSDSTIIKKPLTKPSTQQKLSADSIPKSSGALKKGPPDAIAAKKTIYLTKTQEELVAAAEMFAKRKKFVQDSLAKEKALNLEKPK
jgi:hypothetical protein